VADWPDRYEAPPGAGEPPENAEMPAPGQEQPAPASHVEELLRRHGPSLLAIDGVEGIATGRTEAGVDAVIVFLRDESVAALLPRDLEGVPVQPVVTGPIEAQ
jgi:hypothetical protein